VPQMANLDRIGGIAFDKGCYTGQEIVARLHYLGQLKRRLYLCFGEGAAPAAGSAVFDGEEAQAVGEIMLAAEHPEGGFAAAAVLQIGHAESEGLRTEAAALSKPQAYSY
jgi:folate-binding Fe-S cluster repair protein YgfZ